MYIYLSKISLAWHCYKPVQVWDSETHSKDHVTFATHHIHNQLLETCFPIFPFMETISCAPFSQHHIITHTYYLSTTCDFSGLSSSLYWTFPSQKLFLHTICQQTLWPSLWCIYSPFLSSVSTSLRACFPFILIVSCHLHCKNRWPHNHFLSKPCSPSPSNFAICFLPFLTLGLSLNSPTMHSLWVNDFFSAKK